MLKLRNPAPFHAMPPHGRRIAAAAFLAAFASCVDAAVPAPVEDARAGVFSPDGRYLAFERHAGWDRHLGVMDLATRKVEWVENGPGLAGLASWGTDGSLIYTAGTITETSFAATAMKSEEGFGIRIWRRGEGSHDFTRGRRRDATPSFSPDMKTVYWVSPEGNTLHRLPQIYMWAAPTDAPEHRRKVLSSQHWVDAAVNQPQVSPDGRTLVWAHLANIRDRWGLRASSVGTPDRNTPITAPEEIAYEPRWSADGRYIVYTAFRDGYPSWCCCIQEFASGATRNLGPGREPCLSPDMKTLVRTLDGRLVFTEMKPEDFPHGPAADDEKQFLEPESVFFSAKPEAKRRFSVPATDGFKLGQERMFFVRVRLRWKGGRKAKGDLPVLFAKYDESAAGGFQLMMNDSVPNFWWRTRDVYPLRVAMPGPISPGEHVITAVRAPKAVYLSVDGSDPLVQQMREEHLSLDHPRGLSTGPFFARGEGDRVLSVEVGTGWPVDVPRPATRKELLK